jgi:predicted kinase
MNKFVMLCGLPGSGKSTYAERLAVEEDFIIHSSDNIRAELGDVNDQSKNEEVFNLLHQRVKSSLNNMHNVLYDATNLNRRRRMAFLRELKNIPCRKICVLVAAPWEVCLAQNSARDRQVPEEVMERMYKSFQMPSTCEGFDEVIVHYKKEEWKSYYGSVEEYVDSLVNFEQENSHHTLTLGNHMIGAVNYLAETKASECSLDVLYATYSHDIGKPDVKSYVNGKGETTSEAHYYSHHNCGSYKSLFFKYPKCINKEYVALLIEHHMKPMLEWKQSEKTREKDLKMFGQQFIDDVMLLHAADRYAH